jgi:hypothetical protein
VRPNWAATALVVALSCPATAQVAILQIQIIEGEGGVHAPGARSARPLTVEITDETGRPVASAAVSFHFPDEGPGGVFANGLRTEVATTDERGRATLRGWQLNRTPGRFQIRITASKEQATAGLVSFQYITGPGGGAAPQTAAAAGGGSHSHAKWLLIVGLVAGGAAAGVITTRRGATHASTASPPSLTIGAPAITVGKP